jgi:hypothetical protein
VTYATERSYNGANYECFLCHREFCRLDSLNSHLQSPAHDEKIYRCPNRDGCGVELSTMGALCQHAESDKCGVQRFRYVRDAMDSLLVGVTKLGIWTVYSALIFLPFFVQYLMFYYDKWDRLLYRQPGQITIELDSPEVRWLSDFFPRDHLYLWILLLHYS